MNARGNLLKETKEAKELVHSLPQKEKRNNVSNRYKFKHHSDNE